MFVVAGEDVEVEGEAEDAEVSEATEEKQHRIPHPDGLTSLEQMGIRCKDCRINSSGSEEERKAFVIFNTEDGIKLRLHVRPHKQRHIPDYKRYCGLCGSSLNAAGERGHRSTFKCLTCSVHLYVRLQPGHRKSCCNLWHEAKVLSARGRTLAEGTGQMESSRQDRNRKRRRQDDIPDARPSRIQRTQIRVLVHRRDRSVI